jgi:hypothetical protein
MGGPIRTQSRLPLRSLAQSSADLALCYLCLPLSSSLCELGQHSPSTDKYYVCPSTSTCVASADVMAVVVVYPGVFAFASMLSTASAMSGVFQIWSQGVRDKEFLVELRLQNRDEASKAKSPELKSILK